MTENRNPSERMFNLYGRAERSLVYPNWVLIGQYDTADERAFLEGGIGKHYDEFKTEER